MPFTFGIASQLKLAGVTPSMVQLANWAIGRSPVDFTILWGWRGEADQTLMVRTGASKTPWPHSKHNARTGAARLPDSQAVDFAPWIEGNIPWEDTHVFAVIAGVFFTGFHVLRAADPHFAEGLALRWGGDWDRDGRTKDQTFMDWGHLELAPVGTSGSD